MDTHKDPDVWKLSIRLAADVYQVTRSYPKDELYGLAGQMRRAAVSVASNIAEGAARSGDREFARFLYLAMGSLSELDTQIEISAAVNIGTREDLEKLQALAARVGQMLQGLVRFLRMRGRPLESSSTNHESRITSHDQ